MSSSLNNILAGLIRLPKFIFEGIFYNLGGVFFTPRPRFVCFPVTFLCNSRCQMCNMWQNTKDVGELDLKQIEKIFSNSLFKKVEDMVLHGGEPTLRKDIEGVYKIISTHCPSLSSITSSTNGLNPKLVEKWAESIIRAVDPERIKLTFTVSIDGLKESHEKIRGIPGGFDKTLKSLQILKKYRETYPIDVQIITVMQPQNIDDLDGMVQLAAKENVDINFQPLMIDSYYENSNEDPRLCFSKEQMFGYKDFIKRSFTHEKSAKSLYWQNFLEMTSGGKRRIPCAYDRLVLSLFPTGEVLPCSKESWIRFGNIHEMPLEEIWYGSAAKNIRKKMKKEVCPQCSFYCGAEYSLKKEFFTYFRYYIKEISGLNRRGDN